MCKAILFKGNNILEEGIAIEKQGTDNNTSHKGKTKQKY